MSEDHRIERRFNIARDRLEFPIDSIDEYAQAYQTPD